MSKLTILYGCLLVLCLSALFWLTPASSNEVPPTQTSCSTIADYNKSATEASSEIRSTIITDKVVIDGLISSLSQRFGPPPSTDIDTIVLYTMGKTMIVFFKADCAQFRLIVENDMMRGMLTNAVD